MRARVQALPNVDFVTAAARGLAKAGSRVTGLEVDASTAPHRIDADLVVDASGRGSQAGRWLEASASKPRRWTR